MLKNSEDKNKSDLAPETPESENMESGLLGKKMMDHESSEANEIEGAEEMLVDSEQEAPAEEMSDESILAKLFNASDIGKPGIAGKVAALMKSKMGNK